MLSRIPRLGSGFPVRLAPDSHETCVSCLGVSLAIALVVSMVPPSPEALAGMVFDFVLCVRMRASVCVCCSGICWRSRVRPAGSRAIAAGLTSNIKRRTTDIVGYYVGPCLWAPAGGGIVVGARDLG